MQEGFNGDQSYNQWNNYSNQNQTKYYKLSGIVSKIMNDERLFYLACNECRKKVLDDTAGYRCESCNKTYATCNPTYMITAKISDISGHAFVQFTRELGDQVMGGVKAKDFKDMRENHMNPEELKEFFYNLQFQVLSLK